MTETVTTVDQLKIFEGWEIRQISTMEPYAVTVQNPDTGECREIKLSHEVFQSGYMTVLSGISDSANYRASTQFIKKETS